MKVKFTLSIGIANASQEEIMEYSDDEFEGRSQDEIEESLNKDWNLWVDNFIDGGFRVLQEA